MRFPSETDQRNPVIDILVISAMVPLNVLQATIPLLAPHDLHPAIEVVGDHPVEFVFVHPLDAGLQPIGLAAEPLDCRPTLPGFILKTFAQGALDQFKSSIIESQLPQQAGESLLQDLLADIRLAAFSFEARAVVINVSLLFDLTDHRATTMTARHHAGERKVVYAGANVGRLAPIQDILDRAPKVLGNQRRVGALIDLVQPFEGAGINSVPQDRMNVLTPMGAPLFR